MKKGHKILLILTMVSLVFCLAKFSLAAEIDDVITDLDNVAGQAKINQEVTTFEIIGTFIKTFLTFIGAIFLLLMVYGGVKWMMASGNEEKIKQASDLISKAIIGLIIIIMAYLLTNYFIFR